MIDENEYYTAIKSQENDKLVLENYATSSVVLPDENHDNLMKDGFTETSTAIVCKGEIMKAYYQTMMR